MTLILQNENDIHLDRNLPLHAIGSGYTSYTKINHAEGQPITANRVKTSAVTPITITTGIEDVSRNYNYSVPLRRQANFGSFSNSGGMSKERYDYAPMKEINMKTRQDARTQIGNRFQQSA